VQQGRAAGAKQTEVRKKKRLLLDVWLLLLLCCCCFLLLSPPASTFCLISLKSSSSSYHPVLPAMGASGITCSTSSTGRQSLAAAAAAAAQLAIAVFAAQPQSAPPCIYRYTPLLPLESCLRLARSTRPVLDPVDKTPHAAATLPLACTLGVAMHICFALDCLTADGDERAAEHLCDTATQRGRRKRRRKGQRRRGQQYVLDCHSYIT
jgi:hypothetical protein